MTSDLIPCSETKKVNAYDIIVQTINEGLGEEVILYEIQRCTTGMQHRVYDTSTSQGSYIIRIGAWYGARKMNGSQFRYEEYKRIELPIPKLLYHNTLCKTIILPVQIREKIPGSDIGNIIHTLNSDQKIKIAKKVIEIQNSVGKLNTGEGYGEGTSYTCSRLFPSREAFVNKKIKQITTRLDESKLFDDIYIKKLLVQSKKLSNYFGTIKLQPFIDDLTSKNVLIYKGELSGIVDLDTVIFGDVKYWLGLCIVAFGMKGEFSYIEELIRLNDINEGH